MIHTSLAVAVTSALIVMTLAAQEPRSTGSAAALRGLDPVALCGGDELPGRTDSTAEYEGRIYRFASDANRDRFVAEPARYAIQLGGACARMGPLSGLGDPDRFLVHDEHIFIFASDGCRSGFQSDPPAHLFAPTPRPEAAAEALAAGAELLAKARAYHAPKPLTTLRIRHEDGKNGQLVRSTFEVGPDGCLRTDTDYVTDETTRSYARILGPGGAGFVEEGEPRQMFAGAQAELRREFLREPVLALWLPDAVAVARGTRRVQGRKVEELEIWCDGVSTVFGIEVRGSVLTARFRDRGPDLRFVELERTYDAFRTHGGAKVATQVQTFVVGAELPFRWDVRHEVAVDEEPAPGRFRLSK